MALTREQLAELPSPFYRVAVKALIFDGQNRLLLSVHKAGELGIPGGGWEYDESFEACLRREIQEELGVQVTTMSPVLFVFRSVSKHGHHMLRIVVRAELDSLDLEPGDDMVDYRFVTKQELLVLQNIDSADEPIRNYIDQIWT